MPNRFMYKVNFEKQNVVFPNEQIPSFVLPRNVIILQLILLSNFCSIFCQEKTKEKFKRLALKVVAVAYERFQI